MDKPTEIFVYDDHHPEDNAMLQALYSRSPETVINHLDKLAVSGSGKFMANYYVGYGHASIGDCGSTTIYIEQVSMLVAKAIQDSALYNGQEASTRYLDFSQQRVVEPYNHPLSRAIQERWMSLYNTYLPLVIEGLKVRYPFNADDYKSETVWEKTIKARAFDISRSLLPIGTTTLLSWHTNLRHARDHLRHLSSHPLAEVRDVAGQIFKALVAKYPHSFTGDELDENSERYATRNAYASRFSESSHFITADRILRTLSNEQIVALKNGDTIFDHRRYGFEDINACEAAVLAERPNGSPIPRRLETYGQSTATFLIDFGSFRDLQRHRNCIYQVPVTTSEFGFHRWYVDELKLALKPDDFVALMDGIDSTVQSIADLSNSGLETDAMRNQYLFPMGMASPTQMTHALPQMVYVGELRSAKTVHPTARKPMQDVARELKRLHPTMALYADFDEDSWTAKRGEQDIVQRPKDAMLG